MGKTHQTIVINAHLEDVWARVSDFHDMGWASGVIDSCEAVGELGGREAGAKRLLNGAIHETLIELDNGQHVMRYSIDNGPSPISATEVSNYIGILSLEAASEGGQTLARWTSSWEGNEEAATEFCSGVYTALLDALKASFSASAAG